jgi:hypothetical protein
MCKNKDNPYVQINKTVLKDPRLSWKAKGIMSYFLTLPDDWEFYIEELVRHSSDGERSLRSGIKELIKFGYMERIPDRQGSQRIRKWITNIYEEPKAMLATMGTTSGQVESSTLRFCRSTKATYTKQRTTNNEAITNNEATTENNIVEGQQDVTLKKLLDMRIKKRLRLLANHHIIQDEDISRLANEVSIHVRFRPDHLTESHALNAAIALIRSGKWSTPKCMNFKS